MRLSFLSSIVQIIPHRSFLQIASLSLTLASALFLAKGNLVLSVDEIAQLALTKWNYNPDVIKSLSGQRAETWVGVVFLLVAFILQMSSELWPKREMEISAPRRTIVIAVVVLVACLCGAGWLIAQHVAASTARDAEGIAEARAR